MDANKIADTIQTLVQDSIDKLVNRTYKRGVIAAQNNRFCDVFIEGNTVATKNIICLGSYNPHIGDRVLIVSIGNSGSNLAVLGSINLT